MNFDYTIISEFCNLLYAVVSIAFMVEWLVPGRRLRFAVLELWL
jgi:hypothetical protein